MFFYFSTFLILPIASFSQSYRIHGYVTDLESKEHLIGAVILDTLSQKGAVTNNYGFFSLKVSGQFACHVSYVGYNPVVLVGDALVDSIVQVFLKKGVSLDEVVVINSKFKNNGSTGLSINSELVKIIPVLLGEPDMVKVIQMMPGVQQNKEGTSGFSVRGGNHDQNLFLIDGVPVYNINHLFGFFSVFSVDAINKGTFYKGAIPAQYGGRLSSVIDLRLKEGNNKKIQGNFSAGTIASNFSLDGPLIKDRSTFLVTGRRTYFDLLSRPISRLFFENELGYYFQDYTVKSNYIINAKNRVYYSFYGGNDGATFRYSNKEQSSIYKQKYILGWGNIISAVRLNQLIHPGLFSNLTAYYSYFNYNTSTTYSERTIFGGRLIDFQHSGYFSRVRDFAVKWDLDYFPASDHHLKVGVDIIKHQYKPGINEEKYFIDNKGTYIDTLMGKKISNYESSFYIADEFSIKDFLKLNMGFRYSIFFTSNYTYGAAQPRFSAMIPAGEKFSFTASYNVNFQNVHLLSNSNIGIPSDLWLPISKSIFPQKATQYSVGANYLWSDKLSAGIELYMKRFYNLTELKHGIIVNNHFNEWEDLLVFGEGSSKGIELLLEKKEGKNQGWISYTISKSERTFEEINRGNSYPFKYDRRHNLSLVYTRQFSPNQQLSISWVFTSGYYISLNNETYYLISHDGVETGFEIDNHEHKNNFRTPAYHHLDLNYTIKKQKRKGTSQWNFGIYNLYSRVNPFIIQFQDVYSEGDYSERVLLKRQLKVIGLFPLIPSISYHYHF